jgi:hypothetical protein
VGIGDSSIFNTFRPADGAEPDGFCSTIRHLNFLHGFDFLPTLGDLPEIQKGLLITR